MKSLQSDSNVETQPELKPSDSLNPKSLKSKSDIFKTELMEDEAIIDKIKRKILQRQIDLPEEDKLNTG